MRFTLLIHNLCYNENSASCKYLSNFKFLITDCNENVTEWKKTLTEFKIVTEMKIVTVTEIYTIQTQLLYTVEIGDFCLPKYTEIEVK